MLSLRTCHLLAAASCAALVNPRAVGSGYRAFRASPPWLCVNRGATRGKRAMRRQRSVPNNSSSASEPLSPPPATCAAPVAMDADYFIFRSKCCIKLRQPRVALSIYEESSAVLDAAEQGAVFAAVMRTLLRLQRIDLALAMHDTHIGNRLLQGTRVDAWAAIEQQAQAALFLQLLRHGTSTIKTKRSHVRLDSVAEAERLLARFDSLSPPPNLDAHMPSFSSNAEKNVVTEVAAPAAPIALPTMAAAAELPTTAASTLPGEPLWQLVCRQLLLPLALERLRCNEPTPALALIQRHASGVRWAADVAPEHPAVLAAPLEMYTQLIRDFGKNKCPAGVYGCLDALEAAGLTPDSEGMQVLVDALVQQVCFVSGLGKGLRAIFRGAVSGRGLRSRVWERRLGSGFGVGVWGRGLGVGFGGGVWGWGLGLTLRDYYLDQG